MAEQFDIIYARQSLERPDSVSIEAQIDQCKKLAQNDIMIFKDVGYSGKNTNRPQFEKMIEQIKSGKVRAIIAYRLDRITRNIIDFANLLQLLEKYNVQFMSATEQLDTSSPIGRAMVYIVMVFAQLERETIATRIADNYKYRALQGLYMGGNTPFGYQGAKFTIDGKQASMLVPSDRAEDLQQIFADFIAGHSLTSIAHRMNRAGKFTSSRKQWSSNAIKRVLTNITPCCADSRIYQYLSSKGIHISNSIDDFDGEHGMHLFFKTKNRNEATDPSNHIAVVGIHQPLISSDEYITAQSILNKNTVQNPGKRSRATFLNGIVKCKCCGKSVGIKYTTKPSGSIYIYYYCRGRSQSGVCHNRSFISASDFENLILEACRQHINTIMIHSGADSFTDTSTVPDEAIKIKAQIDNLLNNIGNGNSIVDSLLTKKITELHEQLQKCKAPAQIQKHAHPDIYWIKKQLDKFESLNMDQKASVIRSIIGVVYLDENGQVTIEFAL